MAPVSGTQKGINETVDQKVMPIEKSHTQYTVMIPKTNNITIPRIVDVRNLLTPDAKQYIFSFRI
jgi:hypothetical protein